MDHTTSMGGSLTSGTRPNSPNANPLGTKVEGAAQTAHETMDKMADKTAAQVDRLGGTAHRAVDNAADAVSSAAEWASSIPEQAKQVQARLTEAATESIRARPIVTVAGALVLGYLVGRLARL
jgi:ElaB protein